MCVRRAFAIADSMRHDIILNWALKAGAGQSATGGLEDSGSFADRMSTIRRRVLDVLDLDSTKVEVCACLGFLYALDFAGIDFSTVLPSVSCSRNGGNTWIYSITIPLLYHQFFTTTLESSYSVCPMLPVLPSHAVPCE